MILKILLVIGVIGVVYFFFIKKKPIQNTTNTKANNNEKPQSNDMIKCSACGTYAEVGEMIISNNKYYCCQECVDKT